MKSVAFDPTLRLNFPICTFPKRPFKFSPHPERQSRHWHDVAILADHEIGKTAIPDRKLLADVATHKNVFFRASYAKYEACVSGGLRLIPDGALRDALHLDYDKMIADGMFDGEPLSFDSIMTRLEKLEKEINGKWTPHT